jgi:signal peptidase II
MLSKLQTRLPYLLLVVLTVLLDRWTKSIIHSKLDLNQSVPVIDGLMDITYVQNRGVAFGILNSFSSPAKSMMLSMFGLTAAAIVILYSLRSPARNRLLQAALSLILGGALGNLYDRLNYGYVIDFLEIYFRSYHWPAFNVADSAISTGVVLLALEILRHEVPRPA